MRQIPEESSTATKNGSTVHSEDTNTLPVSPLKQVIFQGSTDSSFPLKKTLISRNLKIGAKARKSSIISLSELKLIRYKLAVALGICCIITLFLLPVIFYYVEGSSEVTGRLSIIKDIGYVNILKSTFCNDSMILNCSDDLVYTYEALRLAELFPFCTNEFEKLFAELQNCSNDSACVESIMCQKVRQQHCTAEWRVLELNESEGLIDCTDYGETALLNCSDQFDLANNGSVCLPLCGEFSQFGKTYTAIFPAWLAIIIGLNVAGGIICLVVSVYKIKKLFRYPQILIVMNSILLSVLSLFIFISTIPLKNWSPLCSKEFLFDVLNEPNVFCTLQGFTYHTVVSLYGYFWFLYTLHLFLRVANPMLMIKLERLKHAKKIHIVEVALAVLLGTVPNIVFAISSRFHIVTFPPLFCGAAPEYNFYGIIVPTIVVYCATLIMMLFVLYKIHIQRGIRRYNEYSRLCCIKYSTSEVKIFLTFCYLLIVMVMLWTAVSIHDARFGDTLSIILKYARCMSGGIRGELDCEPYRRSFEARTYPQLSFVYFTLFSFLNFSNLPFLLQYKSVKLFVVRTAKKLSFKMSASSAST